jgi:thiol-disulfide isomerase/thioredoxin
MQLMAALRVSSGSLLRPQRAALSLLFCITSLSCASTSHVHEERPGTVALTEEEHRILRHAADQVPRLAEELSGLKTEMGMLRSRLGPIEQRTGLANLDSKKLQRLHTTDRHVTLWEGSYLAYPGAKPKKRRLKHHLDGFQGYVVAFWATWCVPCISDEELTHLRTMQRMLQRKGIDLVSVAIDDLPLVRSHKKASKWLYPLWHKDDGHLAMLPKGFVKQVGVNLPLFLVVSKDGAICEFYNQKLDAVAVRDIVTAAGPVCQP